MARERSSRGETVDQGFRATHALGLRLKCGPWGGQLSLELDGLVDIEGSREGVLDTRLQRGPPVQGLAENDFPCSANGTTRTLRAEASQDDVVVERSLSSDSAPLPPLQGPRTVARLGLQRWGFV